MARQEVKKQKKEIRFCNSVEKKLEIAIDTGTLDAEFAQELKLSDEQIRTVRNILNDHDCLLDRCRDHFWFSEEEACNVLYHDRVVIVWKKNKT